MSAIPDVDIASAKFKADPYPYYARLRDEAPVHRVRLPNKRFAWLITRYDDVSAALKDDRFAKDRFNALTPEQTKRQPWVPSIVRPLMRNMLDLDAPDLPACDRSCRRRSCPGWWKACGPGSSRSPRGSSTRPGGGAGST
jgi:cytochrome P450